MGMVESFTKKYGHFAEGGATKMAEGQKIAPVTAMKKGGKCDGGAMKRGMTSKVHMAEGGTPSFIGTSK